LLEYDTLKRANHVIRLEDAINKQLELRVILNENEVMSLLNKMGINSIQASSDVEIFNGSYGYTRRERMPSLANGNVRLKIMSFGKDKNSKYKVYSAKLNTEGVLIEFDMGKIIKWLCANDIITKDSMPDLQDKISLKKWFLENIRGEQMNLFSPDGELLEDRKAVWTFALLHTIAHGLINSAGEFSGLSKNSLSEIIMPETASIFIYALSSQGLTLGSISGMFEQNLVPFLDYTLVHTKECIFDPLCSDRDDSACSACLFLPETSCGYFNNFLSRKYLYSIASVDNTRIQGFWEE